MCRALQSITSDKSDRMTHFLGIVISCPRPREPFIVRFVSVGTYFIFDVTGDDRFGISPYKLIPFIG